MPCAPHQSFRIWGPYGPKTGMIVAASSAGGISLSRFTLALATLLSSSLSNEITTQHSSKGEEGGHAHGIGMRGGS